MRGRFFRQDPGPSKAWYERNEGERLEADRRLVGKNYPTLQFRVDQAEKKVALEGKIVLVTECGISTEVGTRVTFRRRYPLYEPIAYDAQNRFPALDGKLRMDRHILDSGQCCLWLPPRSRWDAGDPEALCRFLDELTVFFDRQLIYEVTGEWPGPEYGHGNPAYLEFIGEELGESKDVMSRLIPVTTMSVYVGRNVACPCGSGKKFKHCHFDAVERVKGILGIAEIKRIFSKPHSGREDAF